MFHRILRLAILAGFVLGMTGGVWAAPRVGLLTPEKGAIAVAGQKVKAPTLLVEGQSLQLAEGAVARVTILGRRADAKLKGPLSLTVTKGALERYAEALPDRRLAVTSDLGNSTRPAALVERATQPSVGTPIDFELAEPMLGLVVSPVAWDEEQGEFAFTLRSREDQEFPYPGSRSFEVVIYSWIESGGDGARYRQLPNWPHTFVQDFQEVEVLQLMGLFGDAVEPGQRYLIQVLEKGSSELVGSRRYRHLTAAESAELQELDRELRGLSDATESVEPLLALSRIYNEYDQLEKALEVLLLAKSSPYFVAAELSEDEGRDLEREIASLRRLLPESWSRPHEPRGGAAL